MPKRQSLSKMQIEMKNELSKSQRVEVQAKRAKSAQKKARKEAILEEREED